MNTRHRQIVFLLFLLPLFASAQPAGIDAALQKGSAVELGKYFDKTVDISIPGVEDAFSSDKAITVLTDFFAKQNVKGYTRAHISTPQEGRSHFTIGDLSTAQGTYRVSLYFNSQEKINEIRIQK